MPPSISATKHGCVMYANALQKFGWGQLDQWKQMNCIFELAYGERQSLNQKKTKMTTDVPNTSCFHDEPKTWLSGVC